MLNEISTGRFNGILRKLLALPQGAPSPVVATEIFPTITLEADRPEFAFLGGVRLGSGGRTDPAVAGNYSHVGVRNPDGSGVISVITAMTLNVVANSLVYLGLRTNATVTAAVNGVIRDSRWAATGGAAWTTTQVVDLTQVAVGVYPQYYIRVPANVPTRIEMDWVLSPGYEVLAHPAGQNEQIVGGFEFYERVIEASEER